MRSRLLLSLTRRRGGSAVRAHGDLVAALPLCEVEGELDQSIEPELHSRVQLSPPEQRGDGMEVPGSIDVSSGIAGSLFSSPGVELEVQAPGKHHPDEVSCEEDLQRQRTFSSLPAGGRRAKGMGGAYDSDEGRREIVCARVEPHSLLGSSA
eukprot:764466-Hanusia_phi.AAC.10